MDWRKAPRTDGTTPERAYPEVTDPTNWRYGQVKRGKPVWVRLDAVCVRNPGVPAHPNGAGVIMTGEVPGVLSRWVPTVAGDWLGVVTYSVQYADGRGAERFADQLVPSYALRPKEG